jgi:plastocyanin
MGGTWSASRLTGPALAVAALLGACLAVVPSADAANRRVAIGDYAWSLPEVRIDRGEHVTWHWIGPDVEHSITGDSPSAAGLDSDPDENFPQHRLGDTFRLDFGAAGTYDFKCKIHSIVRGTVVVSDEPGDPVTEVDPVPQTRLDRRAPRISKIRFAKRTVRPRGAPIELELDERSRLDAEYYRRGRKGALEFVGYERWRGFVGINRFRFAGRAPHFPARPGRYEARLRATDRASNISKPRTVRFRIVAGAKRR